MVIPMTPLEKITGIIRDIAAGKIDFGTVQHKGAHIEVSAQPVPEPAPEKEKVPLIDQEAMQSRVDKVNNKIGGQYKKLSFGMEGDVFYMRVIDTATGQVIKQVPPPEMIAFMDRMEQDLEANAFPHNKIG
jgi:uncharacterized FlaG/YvyC family protein